jgi:hypothetical protein
MRISKLMTTRRLKTASAAALGFCLLLFLSIQPVPGQRPVSSGNDPLATGRQFGIGSLDQPSNLAPGPLDRRMRQHQLNALNDQRQKDMVASTAQLVKLAAELNAQINSAHQTHVTLSQLRTMEEIQKLAKRIRQEMSQSGSAAPAVLAPPILITPVPNLP